MPKPRNDKYQFEFEQMRALPIYTYVCDSLFHMHDDWVHKTALGSVDSFDYNKGVCVGFKLALEFLKNPLAEQYLRSDNGVANKRGPSKDKPRIVPDAENIE